MVDDLVDGVVGGAGDTKPSTVVELF